MKKIWLSQLRDRKTDRKEFRRLVDLLAQEMASTCGNEFVTQEISIETPIGPSLSLSLAGPILLIPIFRAGLALLPAFLKVFPEASVGCMGVKRDEKTAEPHFYYSNLPTLTGKETAIILDPMLATGGTAVTTVDLLKKVGLAENQMHFEGVIASKEGVAHFKKKCPHVNYRILQVDPQLTPNKFIYPGLGDFGDRYFGTESQ